MARSLPELSIDSKILYEQLKDVERGETITYDELGEVLGTVVDSSNSFLRTARKMALREDEKVFEAVPKVGLKCLTDEQVAESIGTSAIARVRRLSNAAIRKLGTVQAFDKMSRDAQAKHNMSLSVLGVFKHFTRPKRVERIESEFQQKQLPTGKTMDLFR